MKVIKIILSIKLIDLSIRYGNSINQSWNCGHSLTKGKTSRKIARGKFRLS